MIKYEDLNVDDEVYIKDDLKTYKQYGHKYWWNDLPKGQYVKITRLIPMMGVNELEYVKCFSITNNPEDDYKSVEEMYSFEMIDTTKPIKRSA